MDFFVRMWQGRGESDGMPLSFTRSVSPFTHVLVVCHFRLEDINSSHQIHFSKMNWKISFRNTFSFLKKKKKNLQNRISPKPQSLRQSDEHKSGFQRPRERWEENWIYNCFRHQFWSICFHSEPKSSGALQPFSFIVASILIVKNTFVHLFWIDQNILLSHQTASYFATYLHKCIHKF